MADLYIQSRLNKDINSLNMINKVWRSTTHTKLKLYPSCVLRTLLYDSECWRLTEKDLTSKAIHLSHQEPPTNSKATFGQKQRPARKVWNSIDVCHPKRRRRRIGHNIHQDASIVKMAPCTDTRRGSFEDHMAADGEERNATDGKVERKVETKVERDHVTASLFFLEVVTYIKYSKF